MMCTCMHLNLLVKPFQREREVEGRERDCKFDFIGFLSAILNICLLDAFQICVRGSIVNFRILYNFFPPFSPLSSYCYVRLWAISEHSGRN